jgi:hypothetical protein
LKREAVIVQRAVHTADLPGGVLAQAGGRGMGRGATAPPKRAPLECEIIAEAEGR